MKKLIAIVMCCVLLTGMLAGCGSSKPSEGDSGTLKKRLTLARPVDSDNMDPVTNQFIQNMWILSSICEGLVKFSDDGTSLQPSLAKSWESSLDGLTWTFHLLESVKFSDGTNVTGADWVFSIERARKNTKSIFYGYTKAIDSIEAPDDKTLVFHLKYPDPMFLNNMAMGNMVVQSKAHYDKVGEAKYIDGPIGTGPYYIKEWKKGEYMLLAKNPHYYEAGKPYTEEIMLKAVPDAETRKLMLQSGEVDIITEIPFRSIAELNSIDNITTKGFPAGQAKYFIINHRKAPFDKKEVREAFRYAIDFQQIVDMVLVGQGQVANTFIPKAARYWNDKVPMPKRDVAKAKELLTQAGYPNGLTFEYTVVSGDNITEQIATIAKQQLAEAGITANIVVLENAAFRDKFKNNGLSFYVGQWTLQSSDPTSLADYFFEYEQSDAYMTGYKNAHLTELNALAKKELDETKRAAYYKEMQQTFYDDAISLPLYWGTFAVAYSKKVKDFHQLPFGNYKFVDVKCYQ